MISAAQIKAARALLSMDQRELSNSAEVAISTVKRVEVAEELTGSVRTLWKIQTALERAGVERCWKGFRAGHVHWSRAWALAVLGAEG